jgi:uncharacterized protein YoxC
MTEEMYIGLITLSGVVIANVFALCTTVMVLSAARKVDGVQKVVVNGSETIKGLKEENAELATKIKQWREDQLEFSNEVRERLEKLEPRKGGDKS